MNLGPTIHGIALRVLLLVGLCGPPSSEASLEAEFPIAPGQTVSIRSETLKMRFTSVVADSRCPKGEQCIVAGNAEILLELEAKDSETLSVSLNTLNEPREARFGTYAVRLIRLDPAPVMNQTIDPAKYIATLFVQKL